MPAAFVPVIRRALAKKQEERFPTARAFEAAIGKAQAGEFIEGSVLTPKLVGDRIGLHPVVVIFAVMAFGQLFGFFGVLLALPAAAVLSVLARFAYRSYVAEDAPPRGDGDA